MTRRSQKATNAVLMLIGLLVTGAIVSHQSFAQQEAGGLNMGIDHAQAAQDAATKTYTQGGDQPWV